MQGEHEIEGPILKKQLETKDEVKKTVLKLNPQYDYFLKKPSPKDKEDDGALLKSFIVVEKPGRSPIPPPTRGKKPPSKKNIILPPTTTNIFAGNESYEFIDSPAVVPKTLRQSIFEKVGEHDHKGQHSVSVVKKKDSKDQNKYYEKTEGNNSSSVLLELEPFFHGCYQALIPDLVARSTKVTYDKNNHFHAVVSCEIPGFVPYAKDKLTAQDLKTDYLKHYSIAEMDFFDENLPRLLTGEIEICKLIPIFTRTNQQHGNNKVYPVMTSMCLNRYRMMRGLAEGLFHRFYFNDGDMHVRNFDKFGNQIDFDESMGSISKKFKEVSVLEACRQFFDNFINPNTEITSHNLSNFPNITTNFRWWPTKKFDPSGCLNQFFANAYTHQDAELFSQLNKNPVFMHHLYRSILKLSLTNMAMWRSLMTLYFSENANREIKKIKNEIEVFLEKSLQDLHAAAANVQGYQTFLKEYGNYAFDKILKHFKRRNNQFISKSDKRKIEITKKFYSLLEDKFPDAIADDAPMMTILNNLNGVIFDNKNVADFFKSSSELEKAVKEFKNTHANAIAKVNKYLDQVADVKALGRRFEMLKQQYQSQEKANCGLF